MKSVEKAMTRESNPHNSLREIPSPAESGIGELADEVPRASREPESSKASRRLLRYAYEIGNPKLVAESEWNRGILRLCKRDEVFFVLEGKIIPCLEDC